jgi:predicted RNA binding protein YcfA (HicA-like mRNA interferase family)
MSKKAYSSHEIISILKDAGFILDRVKGSHHIFLHPKNKKRAVFRILKRTCLLVLRVQY